MPDRGHRRRAPRRGAMTQVPKRKGGKKMKTYLGIPILIFAALSLSGLGQAFATSGDFSISTNCDDFYYLCSSAIITVASINGFSGTVSLTATSTPSTGITAHFNPSSVTVPSGGNANSTLTFSTTCNQHPNCRWSVTVTGKSGNVSHSVNIFVCVGTSCPI